MIPAIAYLNGMWWPINDVAARPVIIRDCASDIAALLPHIPGRDCIVQAGANVGVYPIALAELFQVAITCEPDPANFACLERNLIARHALGRVRASCAAFGEAPGTCDPVVVEPRNCGANRVEFGAGEVAVTTIDQAMAGMGTCDAIWLDVEGAELPALKGAFITIERFSPTICVEDKGLHRAFGVTDGELQMWLETLGYRQVDRFGRDKVFRRLP